MHTMIVFTVQWEQFSSRNGGSSICPWNYSYLDFILCSWFFSNHTRSPTCFSPIFRCSTPFNPCISIVELWPYLDGGASYYPCSLIDVIQLAWAFFSLHVSKIPTQPLYALFLALLYWDLVVVLIFSYPLQWGWVIWFGREWVNDIGSPISKLAADATLVRSTLAGLQ